MGNIREYSPKYMTVEQVELLDNIVAKSKHIYFDTKWKQSIIHAIGIEMKAEVNKLIDTYFLENPEANESRNFVHQYIVRFLGYNMSPENYWLHKQKHKIREEVDTLMPTFQLHQHISEEEVVSNLRNEIKGLHTLLERYELLSAEERSIPENRNFFYSRAYPMTKFKNMVKIEFYNELLSKYKLQSNEDKPTHSKTTNNSTHRQTLLLYYLLEYAKLTNPHIDKTKYANLIHFLTGKSHDNIRKAWANPLRNNQKAMQKDLDIIRPFFEGIDAVEILKLIDGDRKG